MTTAMDRRSTASAAVEDGYVLRAPTAEDGAGITALIAACPPLDQNSAYCNLLQASHFAETCRVAERDGEVVAWVSGYIPPGAPNVFFVWQVAVHSSARGAGLGKRLIRELIAAHPVNTLHTTITRDNGASWGLFRSLARSLDAPITDAPWFEKERHFAGRHDTEHLVSIGPFNARRAA